MYTHDRVHKPLKLTTSFSALLPRLFEFIAQPDCVRTHTRALGTFKADEQLPSLLPNPVYGKVDWRCSLHPEGLTRARAIPDGQELEASLVREAQQRRVARLVTNERPHDAAQLLVDLLQLSISEALTLEPSSPEPLEGCSTRHG
jgi:hypothetical protein